MMELYCTKIGGKWFATAIENDKIVASTFASQKEVVLRKLLLQIPFEIPFKLESNLSEHAKRVLDALYAIYNGKEIKLDFKFEMKHLSPYTAKTLKILTKVPVGYVTTYGALAKVAGGSPRAIGRAMASNPVVLLIPCHRVVKSDLSIGGYGPGIHEKWKILQKEKRGYKKPREIIVYSKKLMLYPVEMVKPVRKRKK